MKCLLKLECYVFVSCIICIASTLNNYEDVQEHRLGMITDIISRNWKDNGWTNVLVVGNFSNSFFNEINLNSYYSFTIIDYLNKQHEVQHPVPYRSNTIVINCLNFDEFEATMMKAVKAPNWHPLSNIILYYHSADKKDVVAKMFFIFWYHRSINAIIIQYDDSKELLLVSEYNPFTCEHVKYQNVFGCWTARKLSLPIESYEKSFICEEGCSKVPLESKRRSNNLGTCLGFDTHLVPYNNPSLKNLKLFQDKGKNLHGCTLRAFAVEVLPFLEIREQGDDSFTLHARDGMLWTTISELMNFTIDLSISKRIIKEKFNFEINIQQVFAFIQRKVDLLLYPLYQFDIIIAEVDNTIAYKESGVCFVSHRAGFETIVFDEKFLQNNSTVLIQFLICFFCTWFVFFIYNTEQLRRFSLDQVGKDFINAFRTVLSISLDKPPRKESFRIFLTIVIWSFFVINFSTQAAIVSIFSAHKRGKEVDTIEDVVESGYPIEGVASPDVVLPEDEEKFQLINSRHVPIQDYFGCIDALNNDSHRFCLIDCAVGRYLERNRLNSKGQQFLHVATRDRIHSHYLNIILHRHSPLTATYNKIVLSLVEAGLIKKWEQYRFNDIKEESPIKPLNMEDVIGILKCYGMLAGASIIIFLIEICTSIFIWIKILGVVNFKHWIYANIKKIGKLSWKKRRNVSDTATQTL